MYLNDLALLSYAFIHVLFKYFLLNRILKMDWWIGSAILMKLFASGIRIVYFNPNYGLVQRMLKH